MEEKRPLVIVAGPTAVGKTEFSIKLAKSIHGAVISADSMQVYRGMDIGSAKITKEEMQGVPHYLVDCLEPDDEFHVVRFCQLAKEALQEIYQNGQIPIIVGGTGFYIQALLYGIDFDKEPTDETYRKMLERKARECGPDVLFEELRCVDPKSCESIHKNNVKRVIRALEYFHDTGKPISEHNEQERKKKSPYNYAFFVLTDERAKLYERIDMRVDKMMQQGLLREVQALKERGFHEGMVSMQGLGYKELLAYLNGKQSLDEAIYIIKRDTRHFAKRQITWFKREQDVVWLNRTAFLQDTDAMLAHALEILKEKEIYG
ncbi:tRNA dimethylallyltransferase [Lachnospiraceae bacterium XBB1006]|nr:tRNA dimethylallyltransferase [Lachnospiraceae bacterium XBB1006]